MVRIAIRRWSSTCRVHLVISHILVLWWESEVEWCVRLENYWNFLNVMCLNLFFVLCFNYLFYVVCLNNNFLWCVCIYVSFGVCMWWVMVFMQCINVLAGLFLEITPLVGSIVIYSMPYYCNLYYAYIILFC